MTSVHVFGKARIALTGNARAGARLLITGRVLGGYIPPSGLLVQLQYQVSRISLAWAPFHTPVRTDGHGRFRVTVPLPPERRDTRTGSEHSSLPRTAGRSSGQLQRRSPRQSPNRSESH